MSRAQEAAVTDETERLRRRVAELEQEVAQLRAAAPPLPAQRRKCDHSRGWGIPASPEPTAST